MSTTFTDLPQELLRRYELHQTLMQQSIDFVIERAKRLLRQDEAATQTSVMLDKPLRSSTSAQVGAAKLFEAAMRLSRGQVQAAMMLAKHQADLQRKPTSPPDRGLAREAIRDAKEAAKALREAVVKHGVNVSYKNAGDLDAALEAPRENDFDSWRAALSAPEGLTLPQPENHVSSATSDAPLTRQQRKRLERERRKLVNG